MSALRAAGISVPAEIAERLARQRARTCHENLILAAECERLQRHLKSAAIPFLFVKGVSLAMLAYGEIGLKKGWDIDLLVDPACYDKSGQLLRTIGYRRTLPTEDATAAQLASWNEQVKESVWTHSGSGIVVELHKALVDNSRLLPSVSTGTRSLVDIAPGITLPTLARDELYAYLCVHGASSAWFRLKWIADLAAFISAEGPEEVERLHHRSMALGGGRTSAVALLLVERLFDRPLPASLGRLRLDPVIRLLVRASLSAMTRGKGLAEPTQSRSGTLPIHLVQLLAAPGLGFLASELRRQLLAGR